MKRVNGLFEKIVDYDNIYKAYERAKKHKTNRKEIKTFEKNLHFNLSKIRDELASGKYRTSDYHIFIIYDPKEREIYKLPFKDRVVHHAIMNVLEKVWISVFISNTFSYIKGRGIHALVNKLKYDLRYNVDETTYCLKFDIKKFYPSVNHDILKTIIKKKIKDKNVLELLDEIINSAPGLPIGNYLSQYLANLYLSYFDHWLKETKKEKYYYRYADDLVILHNDKKYLHELLMDIKKYLGDNLALEVKHTHQVFPVNKRGIDFVGYVFYHTHLFLRKRIKKNFCKKVGKLNKKNITLEQYKQKICSWFGWLNHCNSNNLMKKILMNKFADFNISVNDKTMFNVPKVSKLLI